jgi:antitoxin (DNA-binding transcriptional repressor) of toxin-antitoxin stability system
MQVNVVEAKRDFSKLIRLLETGKEESITVSRSGKPIVKITLTEEIPVSKRIGVAKGKFKAPADFDANNDEVYKMLTGESL